MSRTWFLCGLLAIAGLTARLTAQEAATAYPAPIGGGMVDSETPATYRLPSVPVPEPPATEIRIAELPATPSEIDSVEELFATTPPASAAAARVEPAFAPVSAFAPAVATTAQLLPAVQRGYTLAQRGALFAARTEFVQVLRRVAQAQDAAGGTDERARALAAGLRALDEVEDFMPSGIQLEAELDVLAVASSHRTPVLASAEEKKVLPQEAIKLYHDYAQHQLAMVAAGDQSGSMALYGLGRIYAQLSERRDDDVRTVGAMTMYAASLEACPDNHLAANELGVLKCRAGYPDEAARLFERAIDVAPTATTYHNLAIAQQKLGFQGQAIANEQESQRLAAWERSQGGLSRRAGIQWVSPAEMARVSQPGSLATSSAPIAQAPVRGPSPAPPQAAGEPAKSPWDRTVGFARLLPRPGSGQSRTAAINEAEAPVARRPAVAGDAQWR